MIKRGNLFIRISINIVTLFTVYFVQFINIDIRFENNMFNQIAFFILMSNTVLPTVIKLLCYVDCFVYINLFIFKKYICKFNVNQWWLLIFAYDFGVDIARWYLDTIHSWFICIILCHIFPYAPMICSFCEFINTIMDYTSLNVSNSLNKIENRIIQSEVHHYLDFTNFLFLGSTLYFDLLFKYHLRSSKDFNNEMYYAIGFYVACIMMTIIFYLFIYIYTCIWSNNNCRFKFVNKFDKNKLKKSYRYYCPSYISEHEIDELCNL